MVAAAGGSTIRLTLAAVHRLHEQRPGAESNARGRRVLPRDAGPRQIDYVAEATEPAPDQ
jgi:hypothetical protein